jgi:hypothetical protein
MVHCKYEKLVGGLKNHLEHMSSSIGRIIPYISIYEMENKECSKPPTRVLTINIPLFTTIHH